MVDADHGLSLDLNRISHLATTHDRMLARLKVNYEIKNSAMHTRLKEFQQKKGKFELAVGSHKFSKLFT